MNIKHICMVCYTGIFESMYIYIFEYVHTVHRVTVCKIDFQDICSQSVP